MPVAFCPAWEYHVVPEELACVFARHRPTSVLDALGLEERSAGHRLAASGFRFGVRAADLRRLPERLARGRVKAEPRGRFADRRPCGGCGALFEADRREARYCSRECAAPAGGRPPTASPAEVSRLKAEGKSAAEIAALVGVGPHQVRKILRSQAKGVSR
jgi:hypothetical protein